MEMELLAIPAPTAYSATQLQETVLSAKLDLSPQETIVTPVLQVPFHQEDKFVTHAQGARHAAQPMETVLAALQDFNL